MPKRACDVQRWPGFSRGLAQLDRPGRRTSAEIRSSSRWGALHQGASEVSDWTASPSLFCTGKEQTTRDSGDLGERSLCLQQNPALGRRIGAVLGALLLISDDQWPLRMQQPASKHGLSLHRPRRVEGLEGPEDWWDSRRVPLSVLKKLLQNSRSGNCDR
jgi:hypothetical protein